VIKDIHSAPRGFEAIADESFIRIIKETKSDERIVVC
jgi:hypothetical protein